MRFGNTTVVRVKRSTRFPRSVLSSEGRRKITDITKYLEPGEYQVTFQFSDIQSGQVTNAAIERGTIMSNGCNGEAKAVDPVATVGQEANAISHLSNAIEEFLSLPGESAQRVADYISDRYDVQIDWPTFDDGEEEDDGISDDG